MNKHENTPITDALVLSAHPDDAEIHLGGTILKLVGAGRKVVLVDMTRGEKGTRGTAETRAAECEAATRVLGVTTRENLKLKDTEVRDDPEALAAVLSAIRRHRPRILFAPVPHDLHPDHEATGLVARRAWFHSGLRNVLPELGAPFRPGILLFYPSHQAVEPTLCVDITAQVERKQQAIACYSSQIAKSARTHLVRGLDPLERAMAADRYFGSRIGCAAAEPFLHEGPLRLADLDCLLEQG